jgi:hypothetical protein
MPRYVRVRIRLGVLLLRRRSAFWWSRTDVPVMAHDARIYTDDKVKLACH